MSPAATRSVPCVTVTVPCQLPRSPLSQSPPLLEGTLPPVGVMPSVVFLWFQLEAGSLM